jgi:hypothetical protein
MQATNPAPYNALSNVDLENIFNQIRRHHINPPADHPGCIVTDYAPAANGRPQTRFSGVKYYASITLALRKKRLEDGAYNITNGEEASHLCHYPPCVNPDHLVLEGGDINKTRACCQLFGAHPNYRCPHNPTCFKCVSI